MRARRFYAVYEIPASGLSEEDSYSVVAFRTVADRDAWVQYAIDGESEPLATRGGRRRVLSRSEAEVIMGRIMGGAGRAALALVAPHAGYDTPEYARSNSDASPRVPRNRRTSKD